MTPTRVADEAELLDGLLAQIERRRDRAQRRFEELAHEALRAEAAAIRNELARLGVAGSLARTLMPPTSNGVC
jgi:hypothetical protein